MGQGANEPVTGPRTPEQLQRDVEQTQARLSRTLDDLRRRLAPRQLREQVLDMARTKSSYYSGTGSSMANMVRNNPVPLALIGLGVGWLLMSGAGRGAYGGQQGSGRMSRLRERAGEGMHGVMDTVRDTMEDVRHRATDAMHSVRDQAQHMTGRMTGGSDEMARRMSDSSETTGTSGQYGTTRQYGSSSQYEKTSDRYGTADYDVGEGGQYRGQPMRQYGGDARHRMQEYTHGFWEMVDEHPVVAGVMGLALGAAIGASIPGTRYEDRWLGEYRDDVMERGKGVAEKATDIARSAVEGATEAAREEAQRQGLVSGEEAQRQGQPTRDEAQRQGQTAMEEVQRQGEPTV